MYYCNEFYSLPVLSLYEGEFLGVVDKLYFDKKIKKLLEMELVGEEGSRLKLLSKNIFHIGKNAITVKNNQAVNLKVEESEFLSCPIGLKAYSIKGEYFGTIKEISINDKFVVEKFSLDNDYVIDVSRIASCGKNTIVFYEKDDNAKITKLTPKKTPKSFKNENVVTASILPIEKDDPKTESEVVPKDEENKIKFTNPNFLVGRKCLKDIFNFNNELLIKANSVITKKHLIEINKFKKLRELMLYSK